MLLVDRDDPVHLLIQACNNGRPFRLAPMCIYLVFMHGVVLGVYEGISAGINLPGSRVVSLSARVRNTVNTLVTEQLLQSVCCIV